MATRGSAGAERNQAEESNQEQTAPTPPERAGAPHAEQYGRLAAPFDSTFKDTRGGVELEYITGEQCVTRLNETLGVSGWSFTVREHGFNAEADEMWVLGELVATFESTQVVRQQFGSQKVKRARATGTPLDIGFDLKGAATDALKKCASLIGVGLYLSRKEAPRGGQNGVAPAAQEQRPIGADEADPTSFRLEPPDLTCADCGRPLAEVRFRDGTVWSPDKLAGYGRRKHNRVLCMDHYRAANEVRRRADNAMAEVPF